MAVGRCQSFLQGARPRVPPARARWLELVCGIGDFVSPLREAAAGEERYLPVRGRRFFVVFLCSLGSQKSNHTAPEVLVSLFLWGGGGSDVPESNRQDSNKNSLPAKIRLWIVFFSLYGVYLTPPHGLFAAAQVNDAAFGGTLLPIGVSLTFEAAATGELVCFANDAEGLYGNNRASLNVTVTRESWPPDGTVEAAYAAYVANAPTVYP